jgi:hypothetical protein
MEKTLEQYYASQGLPFPGAAALAVMLILKRIEEEEKEKCHSNGLYAPTMNVSK